MMSAIFNTSVLKGWNLHSALLKLFFYAFCTPRATSLLPTAKIKACEYCVFRSVGGFCQIKAILSIEKQQSCTELIEQKLQLIQYFAASLCQLVQTSRSNFQHFQEKRV